MFKQWNNVIDIFHLVQRKSAFSSKIRNPLKPRVYPFFININRYYLAQLCNHNEIFMNPLTNPESIFPRPRFYIARCLLHFPFFSVRFM